MFFYFFIIFLCVILLLGDDVMKLSYEGRWELRKKIEELLSTVPETHRIKLDKELLEILLFEEENISSLV